MYKILQNSLPKYFISRFIFTGMYTISNNHTNFLFPT